MKPTSARLVVVILLSTMESALRKLDDVSVFLSSPGRIATNVHPVITIHRYASHVSATPMELSEINVSQSTTNVRVRKTSQEATVRNVLLDTRISPLDVLPVSATKRGRKIQTATRKQDSASARGTSGDSLATLATRVSSTTPPVSSVIATPVALKAKCVTSRAANVFASLDFPANGAISAMTTTTAILTASRVCAILPDPNQLRATSRLVNAHVTATLLEERATSARQVSTSIQSACRAIVSPLDLKVLPAITMDRFVSSLFLLMWN